VHSAVAASPATSLSVTVIKDVPAADIALKA